MRIALIGGKGGVGSSLVAAWRHQHELTVLDRSTEPVDGVRDIVAPADDPVALAETLEGVEAVVHLAAHLPRGTEAEQLPGTAEAISTNVGAVLLALRMARRSGARSFVHISSLSVFSRYCIDPVPAGAAPDETLLYGLTKRLAESALRISAEGEAPTPEGGPIAVTSLRLAFPTTAQDWPRWKTPVEPEKDAQLMRMGDGTVHAAMHPEDLVAAVWAALHRDRGGRYEAIAVTSAPHAIDDDAAQQLLDWRPRHVLGAGA
ncbi:NAD-dependent epimerase/dehydratase family protein [Brachybacterium sp. AOP29-B2-41]|uniref:NAD-dependent epimerase/dehydratase family protein n=1 Tax=Brachybacterium sp. AOP29-B2-41 TaxID=3457704 RepID=UPI004034B2A5